MKNYTLQATYHAMAQLHWEAKAVLSSKFLTDEEKKDLRDSLDKIVRAELRLYRLVPKSKTEKHEKKTSIENGLGNS